MAALEIMACARVCSAAQSCPTCVTPWTVARQAPLSMEFFRQEYWSWFPFPMPVACAQ